MGTGFCYCCGQVGGSNLQSHAFHLFCWNFAPLWKTVTFQPQSVSVADVVRPDEPFAAPRRTVPMPVKFDKKNAILIGVLLRFRVQGFVPKVHGFNIFLFLFPSVPMDSARVNDWAPLFNVKHAEKTIGSLRRSCEGPFFWAMNSSVHFVGW